MKWFIILMEVDTMDIITKIKMAATYANISESELARRIGTSPQNLHQRMKVGKFSSAELDAIAQALGAEFACSFRFSDGTEV